MAAPRARGLDGVLGIEPHGLDHDVLRFQIHVNDRTVVAILQRTEDLPHDDSNRILIEGAAFMVCVADIIKQFFAAHILHDQKHLVVAIVRLE